MDVIITIILLENVELTKIFHDYLAIRIVSNQLTINLRSILKHFIFIYTANHMFNIN